MGTDWHARMLPVTTDGTRPAAAGGGTRPAAVGGDENHTVAVAGDLAEVGRLRAAGIHVVAVVAPGEPSPPAEGGPGRLAVLVGDAGDPAVVAAAEEMALELFGP